MKVRVLKCDGCDKILDENPEGGPLDGFTAPEIEQSDRGEWPASLFHLCGFCTFRAKVRFVKRKQEIYTQHNRRDTA